MLGPCFNQVLLHYQIDLSAIFPGKIWKQEYLFRKFHYLSDEVLSKDVPIKGVLDVQQGLDGKTGDVSEVFQTYYSHRYATHNKNTKYCANFELPRSKMVTLLKNVTTL